MPHGAANFSARETKKKKVNCNSSFHNVVINITQFNLPIIKENQIHIKIPSPISSIYQLYILT